MKWSFVYYLIILPFLFLSCDKNENAPIVSDHVFTVDENSVVGTIIGTVEAVDFDEDQLLSYAITEGNADGAFQINLLTGILSVSNSTVLNHEEVQEYVLTVLVSDNHPKKQKQATSTVTINISDVNEFTTELDDQQFSVNENQSNGFNIGQVVATDRDIYQSLTFSITAETDSGFVEVDPLSGQIYIRDSSAFDYEIRDRIEFEVEVDDDIETAECESAIITIDILNIMELTDSLIAYYPFDGNTNDNSGNMNHGVEYFSSKYVDGVIGLAKDFDGSNDYVELTKTLNGSNGLSFSFWIYSRGTNGFESAGTVVSKYNASLNRRSFLICSYGNLLADNTAHNSLIASFYRFGYDVDMKDIVNSRVADPSMIPSFDPEPYTFTNPMLLPVNQWVHCVVNVTDEEIQAWINNVMTIKKRREYDVYFDGPGTTFIGNCFSYFEGANNHLNGYLDELRIYNRGLSEDEIEYLYELR